MESSPNQQSLPKRCFIVSVGTSLVEHFNRQSTVIPIDPNNENFKDLIQSNEDIQIPCLRRVLLFKTSEDNLRGFLANPRMLTECSAELSSLLPVARPFTMADKIYLIRSHTTEGVLCSEVLKDRLEFYWGEIGVGVKPPNGWIETVNVPGLGRPDDPEFQKNGLPNLLNLLQELITTKKEEGYEVILIPTGGYKALIPYMVLAAILHGLRVVYVYERSSIVLELPRIPLGLDQEGWQREQVRLQSLLGASFDPGSPEYQRLDASYQSLVEGDAHGKFAFSPLGSFFNDTFRRLNGLTPLQISGQRTHLLDPLDKELRRKFLQLVDLGPLIWLGDRIPEMVEHSSRHHYDLLAIAEQVLLPILEWKKDFLLPGELFVLLAAIFLHDCGHVIGTLPCNEDSRQLLPTEIRDNHHVLGCLRLADFKSVNSQFLSKEIYQRLAWVGSSFKDTWTQYLRTIAIIGLFHRRKMPLAENAKPFVLSPPFSHCGPFKGEIPPLLSNDWGTFSFEQGSFKKDRIALLVCLLRIIDSLDNQRSRVGSITEAKFHLAELKAEEKEEENRANALGKQIECEKKKVLDNLIAFELEKYRRSASKRGSGDQDYSGVSAPDKPSPSLREFVSCQKEELKGLLFQYAYSRIRKGFKEEQSSHYGDHLVIRNILLKSNITENQIHFQVELVKNNEIMRDPELLSILGFKPEDTQSRINEIQSEMLESMRGEYCSEEKLVKGMRQQTVKEILNTAGIFFDYPNCARTEG